MKGCDAHDAGSAVLRKGRGSDANDADDAGRGLVKGRDAHDAGGAVLRKGRGCDGHDAGAVGW